LSDQLIHPVEYNFKQVEARSMKKFGVQAEGGLMRILNIGCRRWISEEIFLSVEAEFI